METQVFEKLCAIAEREAGIHLTAGKEALVEARVAKRLRILGFGDAQAYLDFLQNDPTGNEIVNFLDVISTNFTSFLRESDHFDHLSKLVSEAVDRGKRQFKVWCAASATGEEPYTIAITILDAIGNKNIDAKILATDISTRALDTARAGRYDDKCIAPLSAAQRSAYLRKSNVNPDKPYEVKSSVKSLINFARLNLSTPPFPMKGPLDVVFCRNVMIYFDRPVRQGLISQIERLLAPGGTLFTGHSESLAGIHTGLKMIRPSIYKKTGSAGEATEGQ